MRIIALAATVSLLSLVSVDGVMAQIASDGTLSTTVNSSGNDFVIENGDRAGNNLFHSFREFSVPTGGSATFNNAIDVQNIFSRVTGGNASNIDGLIRANGRANLFLLNPNGIIFGPNAQLYLGGSFIGSTANRLRFADGTIFDTATTTAPILTVSIPAGLQFGGTSGNIQVNGRGNQEIVPTTNFGLAIAPGQTFALVGGDVTFDGGIATAAAGRLEIGGVAQGEVKLSPSPVGWQFDYSSVEQFRDVRLLNRSSLWNPLSSVVGGIQVQGDRITINNSQIAAVAGGNPAAGDFPGGNVVVNAANALELSGANAIYPFSSWIVNQVAPGATNAGGSIQLTTPQLSIQDGSRVQTLSQGSGSAGAIQVNADSIVINGTAAAAADPTQQDLFNSRITSDAIASGNGGDIQIAARRINLNNGGQVSTLVAPTATGQGGAIRINSSEHITARGINPLRPTTNSGFVTLSTGAGNGGDIRISSDRITFSDGGIIQTQTLGSGRAGNITTQVSDTFTIRRISPTLLGGVSSYTFGAGNGGNISISADHLRFYDGGGISTVSSSLSPGRSLLGAEVPNGGRSGDIRINARQSMTIAGVSQFGLIPSGVGSVTITSGASGNVDISTRRLIARQGASIAAGGQLSLGDLFTGVGTGRGGNVRVRASESIDLQGQDVRTALNSAIDTYSAARGNAGSVLVQTPQLTVQDGATVGSLSSAAGRAGQVTVNANNILVSGIGANNVPAEISATVRITDARVRQILNLPALPTGNSGELTLNADHITVANGGRINVQHQGVGNAGQLGINANRLDLQNGGRIIAETAAGEGGNIRLNVAGMLLMRDRAQVSTTADGTGSGGNIRIDSSFLIGVTNSDIIAQARAGRGGNIDINSGNILGIAPRPSLTADSDINASSQIGFNGTINIENPVINPESGLIELPTEVIDASQQIAQTCNADQTSQFVVTGRGGLPETPTQALESDRPWSDLRDLNLSASPEQAVISVTSTLTEATTLQINGEGQLELVAVGSLPQVNPQATCSANRL